MKSNNIIYADLSTYNPAKSIAFYEAVFGWKFYEDNDYFYAYNRDKLVAGLYETPEVFKKLKMPHFWMTYIEVTNVVEVTSKALELGGKIEVTETIENFGKLALIRDPQGAGFTVYEGSLLESVRTKAVKGTLIWNELHTSNLNKVAPFYEGIFDWKFAPKDDFNFKIMNSREEYIGDIQEIPNDYKGKYEYWVCTFGVESLEETKLKVLENGGQLISNERNKLLMTDNSKEAFFYISQIG